MMQEQAKRKKKDWVSVGLPIAVFIAMGILVYYHDLRTLKYFEFGGIIATIMVSALQNLRIKTAEYYVLIAQMCPLSKGNIRAYIEEQTSTSKRLLKLILLGLVTTITMLIGVLIIESFPLVSKVIFCLSCSLSVSCIVNYLYIQKDYAEIEARNLKFIFENRLIKEKKQIKKDLRVRIDENKNDKFPEEWKDSLLCNRDV